MATMTADVTYQCTNCGSSTRRKNLTVKRSIFFEFGSAGKQKRSRTVAWLCPDCTDKDADWNREKNIDAPLFTNNGDENA